MMSHVQRVALDGGRAGGPYMEKSNASWVMVTLALQWIQ